MAFELPPLPYGFDALEPNIDAQTMQIHHDRHHATYVTNLKGAIEKYPKLDGKTIERFPFTMGAQAKLKPVWETFDGWNESTKGARSFAELPATCIKYVRRVEELVGCPVALLSTSPEREDTILMTDPFRD